MKVAELVSRDESGVLEALKPFALWQEDVTQLDNHRLLAHYTLIKHALGVDRALRLMRELKGEAMLATMLDDIPHCPILTWRPPLNDLVAPRMLAFLQRQSLHARACILVALSEGRPLEDMITLTWDAARLTPWSDFARRVLKRLPPRLGCRYVFWEENTIGNPTALTYLPEQLWRELEVDWSEFASVARRLIQFEHFAHSEIESLLKLTPLKTP